MNMINVDFSKKFGAVKPMHAVNNGPVYKFAEDQRITNLDSYRDAGIPYTRTHDASIYYNYGGEHVVDVHAIFPDFDADPYDESSYDFAITDDYLKVIDMAGAKTFYRLGSKIEHWRKKYGTLPPKDFHKWAVICEHIIKHYNYGWADGFNFGIEYWEIWNEPDLDPDDSDHKRNWGGTKKQFFEFYDIAAKHLKECFPELKIGGPASAGNMKWADEFLAQLKAPLDFFSWHIYCSEPKWVVERANETRAMLDKYGFADTESILNEWNYVNGWTGDDWIYSLRTEKNLKGASFISSVMCSSQKTSIDMLMYYDARPGAMNGLYDTDIVSDILKGYYPFKMFNELYKLKSENAAQSDNDDIYALAASDENSAAMFITYYEDKDSAENREVVVKFDGLSSIKGKKAELYLLDDKHDMELVSEVELPEADAELKLDMKLFDTYLIKIK